jgi:hypothetical protein
MNKYGSEIKSHETWQTPFKPDCSTLETEAFQEARHPPISIEGGHAVR